MRDPAQLNLLAALASALAGMGSALAAAFMIRLQRRWSSADALLRIAEVFESAAFRKYKSIIYRLDRNAFSTWNEEEVASVNAWCAHLDIVSVLIQSRQISKVAFLNLYGDVTLRTIYQIAPYCNHQLALRGKQFLLPLRLLAGDLVRTWKRRAHKKRYPLQIGFPDQPRLRVSPDLFDSDDAVLAFRADGAIR
ncbi:hypothetical protein Nocox_05995 [Nonomuraea coxensis DSM 45129]|uniref:Uncharacterized protein n=1 Tax=Nonomuraea coxensis DSM 45129 TaxID=1122611 RepID=A0ABX8TTP5_9ACTN|nr:hypothetical protein [Nonomuraea coxensis]QYC38826.1 hypothetical protein Nocox_05995 [Nonomuraea coxensis DSM 45129]